MISPMRLLTVCLMITATVPTLGSAAAPPAAKASLFPLDSVRLLDGPCKDAQEVDRKYLLDHDPDRLLAPFRHEAGLAEKAPRYGNWESMGLGGHTAGHYLSALAMMHAATGDPELKRRFLQRYFQGGQSQRHECQGR